jgi:hypothetical protein
MFDLAPGDLATWVAAVGTVGTLGAALWQIGSERARRTEQETQARAERHREQARLVAGWVGRPERAKPGAPEDGRTPIYIVNGSTEPVYNVLITHVAVQGTAPHTGEEWRERNEKGHGPPIPMTTLSILPPGRWRVWIRGTGWAGGLGGRPGAEVAFTDRAGTHWVRRATGALVELAKPPFQHFSIWGPYDLETPEAAPPDMPGWP